MLSLENLSLRLGTDEESPFLLSGLSGTFRRGEFVAVIGPSGCGKSTLLKTIAGIACGEEEGIIRWDGRDLADEDFKPSEIGYVPQFSIAHEELTVRECVDYSARLRVGGQSSGERSGMVERLLGEVGMTEFGDRPVKVLSGGQKRRLALAMELVSSPPVLLCDEVTSGLDPHSEAEIISLLRRMARYGNRLVISVTHSLQGLGDYDTVVVLHRGVMAYAGKPEYLAHYFRVEEPGLLYGRLGSREAGEWKASWIKHFPSFVEEIKEGEGLPPQETESLPESRPGFFTQFATLVGRRFRIFFRSRAQIWLQAGLVFGFPCLVAVFGWKGLPQVANMDMGLDVNVIQQLTQGLDFLRQASRIGSLVSGIVMFEVVLLALMGANNSGREIAGERQILEKEKLSGLSPGAYVASKVLFLGALSAIQSLWMGLFVHYTCAFPGELPAQLLFLFLVNASMTSVCLALSSFLATAEQASLASIYLVGFQLPLSGAVLALPAWLGTLVRPFIAAYWSWSGILQSLRGDRYYDIVEKVIQTGLSASSLCLWVLLLHVLAGILFTYQGCVKTRIE